MSIVKRANALLDIALVLATFVIVKIVADPFTWQYSSIIAGFITLGIATLIVHARNTTWADFGLTWRGPVSLKAFFVTLLQIVVVFVVSVGLSYLTATIAGQFFERPVEADDRFGNIVGNLPLFLWWVFLSWSVGGFMEEMVFRGYFITKLETVFSNSPASSRFSAPALIAVVLSALIFGAAHLYYRGMQGAITLTVVGIIMGLFYLAFGRKLWPLVLTHGTVNTLAILGRFLDQDW